MTDHDQRLTELVNLLQNTKSPISHIRHYPTLGIPHYFYEAGGNHDPPYSHEEEMAIVEAKKSDPPSADEVFENIFVGNKAAAEDTQFLLRKGITHVLNLASDTTLKFFVVPDKEELQRNGIQLKEMKLRDKSDENIALKFRESGFWTRRSLNSGGKVMINCWQGASRSATVVLAYLIQHQQMSLDEALVLVKKKRDIRPNNGFLTQLITLEQTLLYGMNKNLICLDTEEGRNILNISTEERLNDYEVMKKYFAKQSHNRFCGVQSCCIILNTMSDALKYNEQTFWSIENVGSVLDESAVMKSGMTLEECRDLLNSFTEVTADSYKTSETELDRFRADLVKAFSSSWKVIVNYDMLELGQLEGLSGHLSPLAAFCQATDRALLLDVWWETRPCWVPLVDLWAAMDTTDPASGKKRGFVLVTNSKKS